MTSGYWESFCSSGRISDYLKYRQLEPEGRRGQLAGMETEWSTQLSENEKQETGKGKNNAGFY